MSRPHSGKFFQNAAKTCPLECDAHIAPLRAYDASGNVAIKRLAITADFDGGRNFLKAIGQEIILVR